MFANDANLPNISRSFLLLDLIIFLQYTE